MDITVDSHSVDTTLTEEGKVEDFIFLKSKAFHEFTGTLVSVSTIFVEGHSNFYNKC